MDSQKNSTGTGGTSPERKRSYGKGYSVPAGRPYAIMELSGKLGALSDVVKSVWEGAHPLEFEPVADELYSAFQSAAALAPLKSHTGCAEHPDGAVDPVAPEGWSRCLLCNTRRRRGARDDPGGRTTRSGPVQPGLGYPVPAPPYTLEKLHGLMYAINEDIVALNISSPAESFIHLADGLHEAFLVARELSRPRNASGCAKHPGAPIDKQAPPGEECVFCAGRRRKEALGRDPVILPQVRRGDRRGIQRRFPRTAPHLRPLRAVNDQGVPDPQQPPKSMDSNGGNESIIRKN